MLADEWKLNPPGAQEGPEFEKRMRRGKENHSQRMCIKLCQGTLAGDS